MPILKKFIKYLAWALAALLLLALAARLLLAPLTSGAIEGWFEDQGVAASIDDLGFELVDGRLTLGGLTASTGGEQVLALGRLEVTWSWADLPGNRLYIDSIRIDGLDVGVARFDDGRMTIAGIDFAAETAPGETEADPEPAEPLDWTLQLPVFEMTDTRLCYRAPPQLDYCNTLATLEWNGSLQFDLAKLDAEALPLLVQGEFRLAGFESRSNELQRVLANFDQFALEGIKVDTSDDIAIAGISLESLNLFERLDAQDNGFIEHIDRLRVNEVNLARGSLLTIAEILVEGNATEFVKARADGYELDTWLAALGQAPEPAGEDTVATAAVDEDDKPAASVVGGSRRLGEDTDSATGTEAVETTAATTTPAEPEEQADGNFEFAVGKLVFKTDKPLRYRDLSLAKPFAVGLSSTRLVVESIDSRQPEQPSKLTYEARLDGDSLFEIAGTVTPLAPKISFDLAGDIRALDLRQLSPFTAASIGHTIRSGQLDADIKLQAKQAVMNGEIDLTLYHFDLTALSEADAEAMEARFGFPLKTSLSLLKNREGNIVLEVPISGDLENPDFGTGKIITRELSKAITSAVLTFYTPFGLLTAADALFSLATALEFEPVVFEPGEDGIADANVEDLDRVAALMQERPGIVLRFCSHTNTLDRLKLMPRTAGTPIDEIRLDSAQLAELIELGEVRAARVEEYLAEKQIDPARLVHCAAQHDEGEAPPRVEITL